MTTITREDGARFVMQAYRETLATSKKSLLIQEIRMLTEQHGQYVHLSRKANHKLEAAFSKELGLLLGESVWEYFGKPHNLVYCEAMPGGNQILVIVIRQGSVFIDMQVSRNNLRLELVPLMTGKQAYRIVTCDEVPLSEKEKVNHFTFPKDLITSFEKLDEPVFSRLPAIKAWELMPLPLALKSEHLTRGSSILMGAVAVFVLIIGGWWIFQVNQSPSTLPAVTVIHKRQDSYTDFNKALTTAAPSKQLTELALVIMRLYILPGWQVEKINFDGKHYNIHVVSDGGNLNLLTQWARQHGYQYEVSNQGVKLLLVSKLVKRKKPARVYSTQQALSTLINHVEKIFSEKSVSLGETVSHKKAQATHVTIHINNISPQRLQLLAEELKNLPINLHSVNVQLDSGLINGTLQLSVWGSTNANG